MLATRHHRHALRLAVHLLLLACELLHLLHHLRQSGRRSCATGALAVTHEARRRALHRGRGIAHR
ncbi:MAG: DUF2933 domain-containing protein [Gemmatimonadaceae bacterium]|nr:DUF2933 domain-containing protein [Gemmatimonadaceae bacterium]